MLHDSVCPFCGDHVANSTRWATFKSARESIWSHLTFCDASTQCDGLGPEIRANDILSFDKTPKIIEARMTREGLLIYDSIIDESVARAWECILDNRVCVFKELCEDWGPDCQIAKDDSSYNTRNMER